MLFLVVFEFTLFEVRLIVGSTLLTISVFDVAPWSFFLSGQPKGHSY